MTPAVEPAQARFLAVEASGREAGAALFERGLVVARFAHPDPARHHAETLVPGIVSMLQERRVAPANLDFLAVTRGPGSFTSVRIALATVRGLAHVPRLPVYGVDTLTVLAFAAFAHDAAARTAVVALDARRGEVYGAAYRRGVAGEPPVVPLAPARAEPAAAFAARAHAAVEGEALVVGDGAVRYPDAFAAVPTWRVSTDARIRLDAEALGRYLIAHGAPDVCAFPPTPLYLRIPEAERLETAPTSPR